MCGTGPGRRGTVARSSSAIRRMTHRPGRGGESPGGVARRAGAPLIRSTRTPRAVPARPRTGRGVAHRGQCARLAVCGPGPAVLRHERSVAVLRAGTASPCWSSCAPVLDVDPPVIGRLVPCRVPGRPGEHPGLTPTAGDPPGLDRSLARSGRHRRGGDLGACRSPVVPARLSRAPPTASRRPTGSCGHPGARMAPQGEPIPNRVAARARPRDVCPWSSDGSTGPVWRVCSHAGLDVRSDHWTGRFERRRTRPSHCDFGPTLRHPSTRSAADDAPRDRLHPVGRDGPTGRQGRRGPQDCHSSVSEPTPVRPAGADRPRAGFPHRRRGKQRGAGHELLPMGRPTRAAYPRRRPAAGGRPSVAVRSNPTRRVQPRTW